MYSLKNIFSEVFTISDDAAFKPLRSDGTPVFQNCILISADLEDVFLDCAAEDLVINSLTGKVYINAPVEREQKIRITVKKVL